MVFLGTGEMRQDRHDIEPGNLWRAKVPATQAKSVDPRIHHDIAWA